jgi:hypothetical protein
VATRYLLPCSCGQKIPVEMRQAGEIITCPCGNSLEVPTLLKLKTYQRVEVPPPAETPKKAWNAGHRLILLGAVIIIATVAIGGWLFWERPADPFANLNAEQVKAALQTVSPSQSWRRWLYYEKAGPEWHKVNIEITFADLQAQHKVYWGLLTMVGGAGLAFIAGGIIVLYFSRKKTNAKTARTHES